MRITVGLRSVMTFACARTARFSANSKASKEVIRRKGILILIVFGFVSAGSDDLKQRRGTKFFDNAVFTQRPARFADSASMKNQQMRKDNPVFLGNQLHQILFNLAGVFLFRQR